MNEKVFSAGETTCLSSSTLVDWNLSYIVETYKIVLSAVAW